MKKALLLVLLLAGCGGGSSAPTVVPTPAPTPTPAPSFSGSYSGNILLNVAQQAAVPARASVTVTHNGTALDFSNILVTVQGTTVTYGLGRAGLTAGDRFSGSNVYNSSGCGQVDVSWEGWFSGRFMNLAVTLRPARCDRSEIRGEMSRP